MRGAAMAVLLGTRARTRHQCKVKDQQRDADGGNANNPRLPFAKALKKASTLSSSRSSFLPA